MFPNVYQLLHTAAAVTAIVGDRIGAFGSVEPTEQRPYITWEVTSGSAENVLEGGTAAFDPVSVQVNCVAKEQATCANLAKAARAALESGCLYMGIAEQGQDTETKLYRVALNFDFILIN